ncbi:MAG: 1-acyl-sn-glycerol-3-phosphate acyltransferase [Phyllobacteriaceae bacterium]|nr:1-acyl-sn-glycerol-3-phosphate acyltransferase [Phyllobacteriaceae bacterium]
MLFLRSLAFNLFFYAHTIAWLFLLLPTEVMPKVWLLRGVQSWARINRRALEVIAGVRVELRGLENRPEGGAIYASKHQSTFETVSLLDLFTDPTFVLKKELLSIPLFGWYAKKAEQIPVDRAAGRAALQSLTRRAREEMARGRQLVIYPEGTRRPAGAPPAYKLGVIHLYRELGVPMVPVALNSGLFWPRHGFLRPPGTLVVEFLPAIAPGRDPDEAFEEMKTAIETASDRLLREALSAPNPPPMPTVARDGRGPVPPVSDD